MARRRKSFSREPYELEIVDLSHDGRGVARADGKAVFVHGALPGETVTARTLRRGRDFDIAETLEVLQPSPDRVEPGCQHYGMCGGCALQHLSAQKQIEFKQNTLLENLKRIGGVAPETVYAPLTGPRWGYRRKARLSVRWVQKKNRALVGFRERNGRFVADCRRCEVLHPAVGERLDALGELVSGLDSRHRIPQLEVACGDRLQGLVVRHMDPLPAGDIDALCRFAEQENLAIYLQSGGPETIEPLHPKNPELSFSFPAHKVEIVFEPANFVQINGEMNQRMVDRALELLQPAAEDRILDLFCGLGNFTLPLARYAGEVVGVEGDQRLVRQAMDNAARNVIANASYHLADLNEEPGNAAWLKRPYDKVLLDPPRSGAEIVLPHVVASQARQLLYISCHPGSLARDAGALVKQYGYRLTGAGVMDMFPHTAHVESIALFELNI